MINIIKENKKTNEIENIPVSMINLEGFIKNIKTSDLRKNFYILPLTKEVKEFLEARYIPEFFKIQEKWGSIELVILKDGQKRSLKMIKTINNEVIFKNTLRKIKKDLKETYIIKKDMLALIQKENELLKITITDGLEKKAECSIFFDLTAWEYKFVSLNSQNFDYDYKTIKKVLEDRTSSTRKYRKNKK